MTNSNQPNTEDLAQVGDFGTYYIGSDSYAVEVIARTPKSITTRGATVIGTGRSYEAGRHEVFTAVPNERGTIRKFTRRADGRYRGVGANYDRLSMEVVDDYRDPSF